jgi:hypothetical protein
MLKCNSQTPPVAPNQPATLFGATKEQFKSIGKLYLPEYFKACAASRVVYNSAINDGKFRTNDEFGHIGIFARRPNASKQSRVHFRSLSVTQIGKQNPRSF